MPPKIRELINELERNGFTNRGGKGSHRNYEHFSGYRVTPVSWEMTLKSIKKN